MKTISGVRDAFLAGQAKHETWRERFEMQFFGGELVAMLARVWNTMSFEDRMRLKATNPDDFEQLERRFGGM